jgi:hypothetical protein
VDLYAGGWHWRTDLGRTDLDLPAALPWPAPERGRPDLVFTEGAVPEALIDPALDLPVLQIARDHTALVRFDGIGRFQLCGQRVTCDFETASDAPVISAVVFGNVLATFCWQRGQLPLHGSAIAIAGRALLLLGRAATGKSMLAAALALRGHAVLSDEVAVLAGGLCRPAGGALSLADDALALLGIDGAALPRYDNFSLPKTLWRGGPSAETRPYPIGAVICLVKGEADAAATWQALDQEAAVAAILNQTYWRGMLEVGETAANARRAAASLAQAVPIHQLSVPRRLEAVPPLAARIEERAGW